MALKSKIPFREKLDKPESPQYIQIKPEQEKRWGKGIMVISTPREIQDIIRSIPTGKLLTMDSLRNIISLKHNVDIACPLTTGIFLRILAEASEESRNQNITKDFVTYWRVLQKDGSINPKFPGGLIFQSQLLESEGFHIIKKGENKYFVSNFQSYILH